MHNLPPEILRHILLQLVINQDLPHFYRLRGVSKIFRDIVDELLEHNQVLPLWATYHCAPGRNFVYHVTYPVQLRGIDTLRQGYFIFSTSVPCPERLFWNAVARNHKYEAHVCVDYWRIRHEAWVQKGYDTLLVHVVWVLLIKRDKPLRPGHYTMYRKAKFGQTACMDITLAHGWNPKMFGGKYLL